MQSIDIFKTKFNECTEKIKNEEKDEDGYAYVDYGDFNNFSINTLATNKSIVFLEQGDQVSQYTVEEPMDSDGVIVLKYNNNLVYAKILNIEDKPKLYGSKLSAFEYAYCL